MSAVLETPFANQSDEFEAAVISSFEFLETDYGFARRSLQPQKCTQLVIYEGDKLYVVLSYGPPEYEPELSFGRLGVDDQEGAHSFHAGDLVKLPAFKDWAWNKETAGVGGWVSELARLLRTCGSACLLGDAFSFAQMKKRREKLIADWKRDEVAKGVRISIDLAWKERDYSRVLKRDGSIDSLSEIDKKRIAYARSHV